MTQSPKSPIQLSENFEGARPVLSPIAADYMAASDRYSHEKSQRDRWEQYNQELQLMNGQIALEEATRPVTIPASILKAQEEKKKSQKFYDDMVFSQLLADMRERLAELDELLAERREKLQAKYGQDFVGGMAATYLSEDELKGLKTDKDKIRALADKFLDKNGEVKDKYRHLEEAKYVRDWTEAEKIRPTVEKYNGRDYLTQPERKEVLETAKGAKLSENISSMAASMNDAYQTTIDSKLDDDSQKVATQAEVSGLNWG